MFWAFPGICPILSGEVPALFFPEGGLLRGLPGPIPRVTFCSHKKSPKMRQNQGFGILYLIGAGGG